MRLPQTPYEQGLSDGEYGKYSVPRGYTRAQVDEYTHGYERGYEYYRRKIDMDRRSRGSSGGSPVPYIDGSWIPKNGGYS
jgi:hypothetical protein